MKLLKKGIEDYINFLGTDLDLSSSIQSVEVSDPKFSHLKPGVFMVEQYDLVQGQKVNFDDLPCNEILPSALDAAYQTVDKFGRSFLDPRLFQGFGRKGKFITEPSETVSARLTGALLFSTKKPDLVGTYQQIRLIERQSFCPYGCILSGANCGNLSCVTNFSSGCGRELTTYDLAHHFNSISDRKMAVAVRMAVGLGRLD